MSYRMNAYERVLEPLSCTRVPRMEVEANVPLPLRLRRDILAWKRDILSASRNNTSACRLRRECSQLVDRSVRLLALRIHFLSENLGIKLNEVDSLIKKTLPPWEAKRSEIMTSWLPANTTANLPECEVHQRFRETIVILSLPH